MASKNQHKNCTVMANRVLIRIANKDRDSQFIKHIVKDDGSTSFIYVNSKYKMEAVQGGSQRLVELDAADDRSSNYFARTGEILAVGVGVEGIEKGDIAILDYKVDNDDSINVGGDETGKWVTPIAVTSYIKEDVIAPANRQFPKDRIMAKKGEIDNVSDIIGVIRDGNVHAIAPYVFMKFVPPSAEKKTFSGIIYDEPTRILETKILSASKYSMEFYGIGDGATIKVKETDTFKIEVNNAIYLVCNDIDVISISYTEAPATI